MVFKMASSGDCPNSQFWCTSNCVTRLSVSKVSFLFYTWLLFAPPFSLCHPSPPHPRPMHVLFPNPPSLGTRNSSLFGRGDTSFRVGFRGQFRRGRRALPRNLCIWELKELFSQAICAFKPKDATFSRELRLQKLKILYFLRNVHLRTQSTVLPRRRVHSRAQYATFSRECVPPRLKNILLKPLVICRNLGFRFSRNVLGTFVGICVSFLVAVLAFLLFLYYFGVLFCFVAVGVVIVYWL